MTGRQERDGRAESLAGHGPSSVGRKFTWHEASPILINVPLSARAESMAGPPIEHLSISRSARSREAAAWREWWRGLTARRKYGPLIGVGLYWTALLLPGGFRGDHALLGAAVVLVAYAGPRAAPWFRLLLPAAMMGAMYDGQGYVRRALAGMLTIHVAEPANWDRSLFGISTANGELTPAQWLQQHTHPVLDVLCGFTYITFLPVFLGLAIWFRWSAAKRQGAARDRQVLEAETMTWAFFWLGLISCVTYYVFPAAPPWYADQYGFGPAVLDAPASPAGAARVDVLLGWGLFASFYGRSPNVFGAIPSLHVAIPLLAFCFACRVGKLRAATGLYAALMAFSAIYLNHHYVVDVLWGAAYVAIVVTALIALRHRPESSGPR